MKIVMTLLVRDEEDILRSNIDFHLSQGVDYVIATDNLSVDGTRDILKEYEKKGVLHYIYEDNDNYNQYAWVTRMARIASTQFEADWVINNDADEFWWPRDGNLKSVFSKLPNKSVFGIPFKTNIVKAQRTNFVYTDVESDEVPFYERMCFRELCSLNPLGQPLPPKSAHIASSKVNVGQGNHDVEGIGKKIISENLIDILHFPIRSKQQLVNKIVKGGAAYERNTELSEDIGSTWRELYRKYNADGDLDEYLQSNTYSKAKLLSEIESGRVVEDRRLFNYFKIM